MESRSEKLSGDTGNQEPAITGQSAELRKMKYGYSLLLTEKTFTKRLLKKFDAEKLLPSKRRRRMLQWFRVLLEIYTTAWEVPYA